MGYQAALNLVFSLMRMAVATSTVVSRMFCCFEKPCLPQKLQSPDWNLSLVLGWLTRLPFEPLKFDLSQAFYMKTSFFLALVAKTQHLSIPN